MTESINIYRLHKGLDICLPIQIQNLLSNENTIDFPDFDYAADVKNADYKSFASQLNELLYNIPKPMVTIGDTLYVPLEYNINSGGRVDDNAVFYRHILK